MWYTKKTTKSTKTYTKSSTSWSYQKWSYQKDTDQLNFYWISIWRVQNPMLRVVVEKFLDPIMNWKGIDLKKRLYALDKKNNKWEFSRNKEFETKHQILEEAFNVLQKDFNNWNKKMIISNIETKSSKLQRKEPFNLSSLQKECSTLLKIKPKDVLSIAQKLYENWFTSYPRTDSITIPDSIERKIKTALWSDYKFFEYKDKWDFIQEWHHALVFVNQRFSYSNWNVSFSDLWLWQKEQEVYELIVRRTLSAFYKDEAEIDTITYTWTYTMSNWWKSLNFNYQEKKLKNEWWTKIYIYSKLDDELVNYKKWEDVWVKQFILNDVDIKISINISTNTLQKIVQEKWISRPSTWASMLEQLKNKQLIEFDNQWVNIFVKPKWIWFWFLLKTEFDKNKLFETFDLELTREMENNLDDIASWKKDPIKFMNWILKDCFNKYL